MARPPRNFGDGVIYHLLNRGNAKQQVFHQEGDYRAFLNLLRESKEEFKIKLYAYCLMPNHFHVNVSAAKGKDISVWMHWLENTHVHRYQKYYGTSGHLWQGRFKDFAVCDDAYCLTVMRYVERNPVRAGLVKSAVDWPWSSHRERVSGEERGLLDAAPVELPSDWRKYVDTPLTPEELKSIHTSIARHRPYGPKEWQKQICQQLGIEITLKPRGRPKKVPGTFLSAEAEED